MTEVSTVGLMPGLALAKQPVDNQFVALLMRPLHVDGDSVDDHR
jgi:hypothetical protein